TLHWYARGENASKERRAELRKVAEATVAAKVAEAKVEIDRVAAQQMTQITQGGLTSEEAQAFIKEMPKPEELLPPLATLELHNGQLIALEAPLPVTSVTADVTPDGESVTPNRNVCAFCGEAFTPARSDARYCKPACRVADHRRRLRAAEGPTP